MTVRWDSGRLHRWVAFESLELFAELWLGGMANLVEWTWCRYKVWNMGINIGVHMISVSDQQVIIGILEHNSTDFPTSTRDAHVHRYSNDPQRTAAGPAKISCHSVQGPLLYQCDYQTLRIRFTPSSKGAMRECFEANWIYPRTYKLLEPEEALSDLAVGDHYTIADARITPQLARLKVVTENDLGMAHTCQCLSREVEPDQWKQGNFPAGMGYKLGEELELPKFVKFMKYVQRKLERPSFDADLWWGVYTSMRKNNSLYFVFRSLHIVNI
jgi:hypothetical protein